MPAAARARNGAAIFESEPTQNRTGPLKNLHMHCSKLARVLSQIVVWQYLR
jgi:hypothetical protein